MKCEEEGLSDNITMWGLRNGVHEISSEGLQVVSQLHFFVQA